jgi:hypothetical protein
MQSPGNHQMQHQPQIAIHPNRNPLPNAPHPAHHPPLHLPNPRLHSSQQKSITQPHPLKPPPNNPWFKGRDVSRNIRQLRHSCQNAAPTTAFATRLSSIRLSHPNTNAMPSITLGFRSETLPVLDLIAPHV